MWSITQLWDIVKVSHGGFNVLCEIYGYKSNVLLCIHTHTHTHTHTLTNTHTHKQTHTHSHTHTNTQTHTLTNTQTHTHKHTHTMHALNRDVLCGWPTTHGPMCKGIMLCLCDHTIVYYCLACARSVPRPLFTILTILKHTKVVTNAVTP